MLHTITLATILTTAAVATIAPCPFCGPTDTCNRTELLPGNNLTLPPGSELLANSNATITTSGTPLPLCFSNYPYPQENLVLTCTDTAGCLIEWKTDEHMNPGEENNETIQYAITFSLAATILALIIILFVMTVYRKCCPPRTPSTAPYDP